MFPKTREILSTQGPLHNVLNPEVPGLAARPPAPVPQVSVSPAASDPPAPSMCRNCAPLQKTLDLAFEQLRAAQTRLRAAIIVGTEAVQCSNERIGAYDALYHINRDHGMPFKNGRLPREYLKKHPRHDLNDPYQGHGDRDPQRDTKEETGKARDNPPPPHHGRPPPLQAGCSRDLASPYSHAPTNSGEESEESEESIPPGHSVGNSGSEGDDLSIYDGDSERDGDWELDPNAVQE